MEETEATDISLNLVTRMNKISHRTAMHLKRILLLSERRNDQAVSPIIPFYVMLEKEKP